MLRRLWQIHKARKAGWCHIDVERTQADIDRMMNRGGGSVYVSTKPIRYREAFKRADEGERE